MPNNLHDKRPDAQANDASRVIRSDVRDDSPAGLLAKGRRLREIAAQAALRALAAPTLPEPPVADQSEQGRVQEPTAAPELPELLAAVAAAAQLEGPSTSCLAAAQRPAPELAPERAPMWKVSRRERRIAAEVLSAEDERAYRFEWMTPDHLSWSDAELEATNEHRKRLLAQTRRKDGSRLARLEVGVLAQREALRAMHSRRCKLRRDRVGKALAS